MRTAVGLLTAASAALAACAPAAGGAKSFDAMSAEEHLACAVDISAYTYLASEQRVAEDRDLLNHAGIAAGWHFNAFSVPPGQAAGKDIVNRMRPAVMAKDPPEAITTRAAACIAAAVAKSEAE